MMLFPFHSDKVQTRDIKLKYPQQHNQVSFQKLHSRGQAMLSQVPRSLKTRTTTSPSGNICSKSKLVSYLIQHLVPVPLSVFQKPSWEGRRDCCCFSNSGEIYSRPRERAKHPWWLKGLCCETENQTNAKNHDTWGWGTLCWMSLNAQLLSPSRCGWAAQRLLGMYKAMGSIPTTTKKPRTNKKLSLFGDKSIGS